RGRSARSTCTFSHHVARSTPGKESTSGTRSAAYDSGARLVISSHSPRVSRSSTAAESRELASYRGGEATCRGGPDGSGRLTVRSVVVDMDQSHDDVLPTTVRGSDRAQRVAGRAAAIRGGRDRPGPLGGGSCGRPPPRASPARAPDRHEQAQGLGRTDGFRLGRGPPPSAVVRPGELEPSHVMASEDAPGPRRHGRVESA